MRNIYTFEVEIFQLSLFATDDACQYPSTQNLLEQLDPMTNSSLIKLEILLVLFSIFNFKTYLENE